MLAVFTILTISCLINLVYVMQTLNTAVFLDAHDGLAMATSALNVVALGSGSLLGVDADAGRRALRHSQRDR